MSPVFGVGKRLEDVPCFRTVGKDKQSLSAMGGTNVGSSKACPVRVIPERGQVAEYSVEAAAAEGGDVLHDDELRS